MAAQTIEFSFLSSYALTLTVLNQAGAAPLHSNIACVQVTAGGPDDVCRYRATIDDTLNGIYPVKIYRSSVLVLADKVRLMPATATFLVHTLSPGNYPDPKFVLAGVDRGDGVEGTFQTDLCLPVDVVDQLPVPLNAFAVNSKVVVLDSKGRKTKVIGTIMSRRPNDKYLVRITAGGAVDTLKEHYAGRLLRVS